MQKDFLYSLIGHLVVFALLFVTVPDWRKTPRQMDAAPIIIDLKNVQIGDKTQVPARAANSAPAQKQVQKKIANVKVPKHLPPRRKSATAKAAPAPKPVQKASPATDAVKMASNDKANQPLKPEAKPKAKPSPVPSQTSKTASSARNKQAQDDMDSLLASVEKMAQTPTSAQEPADELADMVSDVLGGMAQGSGTSVGDKITLSQVDFIASKVRENWNIDAGLDGIDNIVVEVLVLLTPEGRVYKADIVDADRYAKDRTFRSLADSARRAVYISDKQKDQSPFVLLAQRFPDRYSSWKKMYLRFNPLDKV